MISELDMLLLKGLIEDRIKILTTQKPEVLLDIELDAIITSYKRIIADMNYKNKKTAELLVN
jgi:hypothetical protein